MGKTPDSTAALLMVTVGGNRIRSTIGFRRELTSG
jgi:hypothetical protein